MGAGMIFLPLPMDTLAAWSDTEVRRIWSSLARHTAGEEGEVTKHLSRLRAILVFTLGPN